MPNKIKSFIDTLNPKLVRDFLVEQKENGLEPEQIRSNLERSIREKALTLGDDSIPLNHVQEFMHFVIDLAKTEAYLRTLTVTVMQDVFDISTISRCEVLFSIIEENIDVWKTQYFFDSCKNLILRMSNDLLKRLSRTINTNFCGRILILLARSLPLNERSGLNLPGQFNLGNITIHDDEEKKDLELTEPSENGLAEIKMEEDTDMEVGEIREKDPPAIDESGQIPFEYQLYVKFWGVQKFFVNPNSLYENLNFKEFNEKINDILNVFTTYKLERPQKPDESNSREASVAPINHKSTVTNSVKTEQHLASDNSTELLNFSSKLADNGHLSRLFKTEPFEDPGTTNNGGNCVEISEDAEHCFFAKYLTSQKLFHLQLADSQFRRYFICQCLIVANYLTSKARHKDALALSLSLSQDEFLREMSGKGYSLLRETFPNGSHFADAVKKIMTRDNLWAQWKSDNCPDLVTSLLKEKVQKFKRRDIGRYDPSIIDLGSKELTRLWRIYPDNLDACRDPHRHKMPIMRQFLEDTLDDLDPEQQVEEQYLSVNEEKFQWWGSRFLLFNSDQYLTCSPYDNRSQPFPLPTYLKKAVFSTSESVEEYQLKERSQEVQRRVKERDDKIAEEKARQAAEEAERLAKERREKEATEEAKRQQQKQQIKESGEKRTAIHGNRVKDEPLDEEPAHKKPSLEQQKSIPFEDEERKIKRRMEERAAKTEEERKTKRAMLDGDIPKSEIGHTKTFSSIENKTGTMSKPSPSTSDSSTKHSSTPQRKSDHGTEPKASGSNVVSLTHKKPAPKPLETTKDSKEPAKHRSNSSSSQTRAQTPQSIKKSESEGLRQQPKQYTKESGEKRTTIHVNRDEQPDEEPPHKKPSLEQQKSIPFEDEERKIKRRMEERAAKTEEEQKTKRSMLDGDNSKSEIGHTKTFSSVENKTAAMSKPSLSALNSSTKHSSSPQRKNDHGMEQKISGSNAVSLAHKKPAPKTLETTKDSKEPAKHRPNSSSQTRAQTLQSTGGRDQGFGYHGTRFLSDNS